MLANSKEY
jgi:hypothetical protein